MPFGDHLRTNENIDLSRAKSAEDALEITQVAHRVAIHSADAGVGINALEFVLEPLGSLADIMDVLAVALRTMLFRAAGQTAVLA